MISLYTYQQWILIFEHSQCCQNWLQTGAVTKVEDDTGVGDHATDVLINLGEQFLVTAIIEKSTNT